MIPGIELSCEHGDSEVHILGLFIDWGSGWLRSRLRGLREAREKRALLILEKLNKEGVKMSERALLSFGKGGSIGRLHFARYLIENGYVSSVNEAFSKYLGRGKPAYIAKPKISPVEALDMINRTGGLSVIAHPVYGGDSMSFIKMLKSHGLCGIEVHHPGHDSQAAGRLLRIASELNLIATGGSDSHGTCADSVRVGCKTVSYEAVMMLKKEKLVRETGIMN